MRWLIVLSCLLVFCTTSGAASRTNYALLVGASEYPSLAKDLWLGGPANDVRLVADYLQNNPAARFERKNITILADGVEGADGLPTLQAIRNAFQEMALKLTEGDFVYLHFSGHGAQLPAREPEKEADGLDEIFLPVDIGMWRVDADDVENALLDDEIGKLIDTLSETGAQVWVVFDSCHSGTVTRAAPTGDAEVRLRRVSPADLGLPVEAMDLAAPATRNMSGRPDRPETPIEMSPEKGGLVAFFAAQSNQETIELRLPSGKRGRKTHGVFTFTLFEVMAEYPGMTYRQLARELLRRYVTEHRAEASPLFEGDLDRIVFGGERRPPLRQWPVSVGFDTVRIGAGQLHRIEEGDRLAVVAKPNDSTEAAIGWLEVVAAGTLSSSLVSVAEAGLPALPIGEIPAGSYVRTVSAPIDYTLRVSLPQIADGPIAAPVLAAIKALEADPPAGLRLNIVPSASDADLRLAIIPESSHADHVWLVPPSGFVKERGIAKTPSIAVRGKSAEALTDALSDTLLRVARATNLLKLGGPFNAAELDVAATLVTRDRQRRYVTLDSANVPRLVPGDGVWATLENHEDFPVDTNIFYIGSDWSISHHHVGRLLPGEKERVGLVRITAATGRERVLAIFSPAEPQTTVENLAFLEQKGVPQLRAGGRRSRLGALLFEAGFGQTTRAAVGMADDGGPAGAIIQLELETVPAR